MSAQNHSKRKRIRSSKAVGKSSRKQVVLVAGIVVCVAGLALALFATYSNRSQKRGKGSASNEANSNAITKVPRSLDELLKLKPSELVGVDIGLMNLLCAEGLHGSEKLDVPGFLNRLDGMAEYVRYETARHSYKLREPEFRNSEGYFRMLYLFTVLQRDHDIHYNPDRITEVGVFEPNMAFFADSRDVFIHGMIDTNCRMGTCASMPVLYLAVGRRLGYPLKLVPTKNHLFIRWEDRRERFNIDATGVGMSVFDDEHFQQWPFPVSNEEMREFGYLKSMTPAEELRVFVSLRGHCLLAMGKLDEALAAHEAALRFAPDNKEQQLILATAMEEVASRRAPLEFLPPEQLQHGAVPVGFDSREMRVARAQQLGRLKHGEIPAPTSQPQGIPGYAPTVLPDPNPLKQIQNQFTAILRG